MAELILVGVLLAVGVRPLWRTLHRKYGRWPAPQSWESPYGRLR